MPVKVTVNQGHAAEKESDRFNSPGNETSMQVGFAEECTCIEKGCTRMRSHFTTAHMLEQA